MIFAHDTEASLVAAVHLVNSAADPDTLVTTEDLVSFLATHHYTSATPRDGRVLAEVQALRPPLRALLSSERDTAAGLVNALLTTYPAAPRLVRHGEEDWHVHAVPDDAPLATQIAVETAMAMIDVIRLGEVSRLSVCKADRCDGLVLDLSRNRSRRFCSVACSNRAAVAAYRRRRLEY